MFYVWDVYETYKIKCIRPTYTSPIRGRTVGVVYGPCMYLYWPCMRYILLMHTIRCKAGLTWEVARGSLPSRENKEFHHLAVVVVLEGAPQVFIERWA